MYRNCKTDGGFVDQRKFKTSKTFLFDSVLFDDSAIKIVDLYVDFCRPLLKPKSDFLLVTSKGNMCTNLCHSMILIVHSAIQKFIHPTRYRQIVETASGDILSQEEQAILSEDQKHSSEVAKTYYKKKMSRDVAQKGKKAMEKLTGSGRTDCNTAISNVLDSINQVQTGFDMSFLPQNVIDLDNDLTLGDKKGESNENEQQENIITEVNSIMTNSAPSDAKIEEEISKTRFDSIRFTEKEDECLNLGIKKYGLHKWAEIIADKSLSFHSSRSRDSIRVRAGSRAFKRKFDQV